MRCQTKDKWEKVEPGLFKRSDCRKFYIRFQHDGVEYNKAAGSDLKAARKMLYHLRARARMGSVGLKDNNILVKNLYAAYLSFCRQHLKRSTVKSYEACFERLWEFFTCERVSDLTVEMVTEYIKCRREGDRVRDATIRRELTLLGAMLRFGEQHGLLALNPLRHLPAIKIRDKAFRRALAWAEFEKLLDHKHPCGSRYGTSSTQTKECTCRDVWLLLGETGLRRGELAALRWSDVDFAEREIIVRGHEDDQGPKTPASHRRVPMSDRVYAMLQSRSKAARNHLVFSTRRGTSVLQSLRRKLRSCLKAAGVDKHGVCLHSFRYSFTSWLIQAGVSPKTAMVLLGHRDIGTTMRVYSQSFREDERDAVKVFDAAAQGNGPQKAVQSHASLTLRPGFHLGVA